MNNLTKLKQDRDVCYILACAAYGQAFVNQLLWEGDDLDDEGTRKFIEDTRASVPLLVVDSSAREGCTIRTTTHEHEVQLPDGMWREEDADGRYSSDDL